MMMDQSNPKGSMVSNILPPGSELNRSGSIEGVGILTEGDSTKVGESFKGTGFVVFKGRYVITSAHNLLSFNTVNGLTIHKSQPKFFHTSDKTGKPRRLQIKNWIICKEWKTYFLCQLKKDVEMGLSEVDIHEKLFVYDYALLELKDAMENSIQIDVCDVKEDRKREVMVFGYSSELQLNGGKTMTEVTTNGTRLIYDSITKKGNSGSPVMIKINDKEFAIAIHKCSISANNRSSGILITQSIYNELQLMRENLQNWQNIESLTWEMNNKQLYKYYDVNGNTIVRTREKRPEFVLLTSQKPLDREKTQIYGFSLRYCQQSAISFGLVDEKTRFNMLKSFSDPSSCQGMITFTSTNGTYQKISKIYQSGHNLCGKQLKFPPLKMLQSDFKEQVQMVVNLQQNERNIIWRVQAQELKINLKPQKFGINENLYLFVSMPVECRVRIRKIYMMLIHT